jgi:hypothetical protein
VQFSLQSLMLSFVIVGMAAALCGWWGLPLAVVILAAAGYIRMAENRRVAWIGVILIAGLGIFLFWPVSPRCTSSRRSQCQNNQYQIARALLSYESEHGHLPPAYIADANGKPMHSWRVLILPYLDRNDLYKAYRFDEPWDGPNNSKLPMPSIFACPSAPSHGKNNCTSYVAATGPETVWPDEKTASLVEVHAHDGNSKTILLLELPESDINWLEPRDLTFDQLCRKMTQDERRKVFDAHLGTSVVTFADGHTEIPSNGFLADNIAAMLTKAGGKNLNFDDQGPGVIFRSTAKSQDSELWITLSSMLVLVAATLFLIYRPLKPQNQPGPP